MDISPGWHACFGVIMPWCGGGVKGAGLERFARSANDHRSYPTSKLAGTPISAMRLREDGAPKFQIWASFRIAHHPTQIGSGDLTNGAVSRSQVVSITEGRRAAPSRQSAGRSAAGPRKDLF